MLQKDILFEDNSMIVVHKPAGIATQTARVGERDIVSEVKNHIRKDHARKDRGEPYAALINRLDQPVEGIVVLGKTKAAAAELNRQLTENMMDKYYLAGVCGNPPCMKAVVADYMIKKEGGNLSYIVEKDEPGAQKAVLEYEIIETAETDAGKIYLAEIHLITGRHHQIRVQMANAGMPLLGDTKYGSEEAGEITKSLGIRMVALCAYRLSFSHPVTKKRMQFEVEPDGSWYREYKGSDKGRDQSFQKRSVFMD